MLGTPNPGRRTRPVRSWRSLRWGWRHSSESWPFSRPTATRERYAARARPQLAAVGATALAGLILTVLVLTTGGDDVVPSAGPFPVERLAEEELLRPLGLCFAVLAPLWFAAVAATRLPRR